MNCLARNVPLEFREQNRNASSYKKKALGAERSGGSIFRRSRLQDILSLATPVQEGLYSGNTLSFSRQPFKEDLCI